MLEGDKTQLKHCYAHIPDIYRAPFTICKCEVQLSNAQMQKFHHWAEFNNSPVFKCVDNGHCDCAPLQSKSSTIHHRTLFATGTTWAGGNGWEAGGVLRASMPVSRSTIVGEDE